MLLAQCLAVELEVIVSEDDVAVLAAEAVRVEFLLQLGLQVLSFDAAITVCA